jgi:MFS family permease
MTSSIGLYCDLEWARVLIQACFPIGSFTGLMVMNLVSDTRGRRQAFLISLFITVIGIICIFLFYILVLLIGAYNTNPILLMISQFMRGFGAESIMPLCYTMCADFFSDKMRPKAIVMLNSSG